MAILHVCPLDYKCLEMQEWTFDLSDRPKKTIHHQSQPGGQSIHIIHLQAPFGAGHL